MVYKNEQNGAKAITLEDAVFYFLKQISGFCSCN